jgi:2-phospho-L-lactate/phosphoenolpyruvate guanylyltransferase
VTGGVEAGTHDRWVLVPVKAFSVAKERLGTVLDASARARLSASMAAGVLRAAAPLPVCVACDDDEVAAFAEANGASVAWTPGLGLNGAVERGVELLTQRGAAYVTIVHGDLPNAVGIGAIEHFDGVTIAPDRARKGTNLLRVPTDTPFTMQFGRGSLDRHLAECSRRDLECLVLRRDDLAFDVDLPQDLAELGTRIGGTP